ncbi:MAG: family 16 glycoside hydrolase, partial [Bacteroidota bacterium]
MENNADNLLTPQEVQEGWQLLFDGNSFNGWHSYGKDSIQGWMIEDGQLTNDPEVSGGDLTTNNQYSNFE